MLRERGWQVPAYTFPANREDLAVLRIVCRNGFSQDLADDFLNDLQRSVDELQKADHKMISGPSGLPPLSGGAGYPAATCEPAASTRIQW